MKFQRAQSSIEFISMIGIASLFMIVVLTISNSQFVDISNEELDIFANDVALKLQKEIQIASTTEDGYERDFTLPEKIKSKEYNVSILNNTLSLESSITDIILRIPPVNGQPIKGQNTIRKNDNEIYLNS